MKKKFYQNPLVLFFGGAILLVVVLVVIQNWPSGPGQYDTFTKCLTEKGTKMYGAYWCPHCKEQKKLFGPSWQYVKYVECAVSQSQTTLECQQAGIKGYPTWEFADSSRVEGKMTLEGLAQKSSCELVIDQPATPQ